MLSSSDRLDIVDLVHRADNAATQRNADLYVSYFTDDAVLDGDQGEHRGLDHLRQSVGPIWASEGPSSTHATLNVVVDTVDNEPDRAIASSLLLILRNELPAPVENLSFITQHVVRTDEGWLIARRTVRSVPG